MFTESVSEKHLTKKPPPNSEHWTFNYKQLALSKLYHRLFEKAEHRTPRWAAQGMNSSSSKLQGSFTRCTFWDKVTEQRPVSPQPDFSWISMLREMTASTAPTTLSALLERGHLKMGDTELPARQPPASSLAPRLRGGIYDKAARRAAV